MKSTPVGWLFGIATLTASALLFAVQPMIGKMLLPSFGGAPGVWNACMAFFQAMLLAGYAYAHMTTSRLGLRSQLALHASLAVAALSFLPLASPADRLSSGFSGIAPGAGLFGLLLATAGLPFLVIAATAPLLQRWYSLSDDRHAHDPYFLYAASNTGNLAALASYPLLIEPLSTLGRQNLAWAWGFAASSALTLACAAVAVGAVGRRATRADDLDPNSIGDDGRIGWTRLLEWVVLAAIPSSWLLAVTTYATTDLASMPLLWTIPLAVYLATYILAFGASGTRVRNVAELLFPWLVASLALVLGAGFVHVYWILLHALAFFLGALLCHQRLAATRPPARRLTLFYLAIAFGGMLGSVFNAILAPSMFDRMIEYPLAIFLTCLVGFREPGAWEGFRRIVREAALPSAVLGLSVILIARRDIGDSALGAAGLVLAAGLGVLAVWRARRRPLRFAMTIGAILLAGGLAPEPGGEVVYRSRNFFGTLRVLCDPAAEVHRLVHGSTLHGQQSLEPSRRAEPSTYFTRSGPIGDLFGILNGQDDARVAIVGLGAGTLACYARRGQSWTFFEIDDAVVRIAEDPRFFTYLADARKRGATVAIVEGDARLRIGDAPDGGYRLIVLDAFSSDAVPVHLLSREAIALYLRKLAPGGVLAFNLSNRYLDLDPLMGVQARRAGLVCRIRYDLNVEAEERRAGKLPSIWALMARRETDLADLIDDPHWRPPLHRAGATAWTDDYSELASYLVFRPRWARGRAK